MRCAPPPSHVDPSQNPHQIPPQILPQIPDAYQVHTRYMSDRRQMQTRSLPVLSGSCLHPTKVRRHPEWLQPLGGTIPQGHSLVLQLSCVPLLHPGNGPGCCGHWQSCLLLPGGFWKAPPEVAVPPGIKRGRMGAPVLATPRPCVEGNTIVAQVSSRASHVQT